MHNIRGGEEEGVGGYCYACYHFHLKKERDKQVCYRNVIVCDYVY